MRFTGTLGTLALHGPACGPALDDIAGPTQVSPPPLSLLAPYHRPTPHFHPHLWCALPCPCPLCRLIKFVARTLYTQSDHLSSSEAGLSKLLRYKLDQQLSRVPSFKMILVGAITGALIILGGMALFAAGEESLYSAFW